MKQPIIGITPLVDEKHKSFWMLPGYMDAVARAGGLPIMLPLTADEAALDALVAMCDGLLITGGQDVDPSLYGEKPINDTILPNAERDAMELPLLQKALAADKPIFGICRGLQFINAALGGTLYQDLPVQHPSDIAHNMSAPYDRAAHEVEVEEDSPLYALLGKKKLGVNTLHHQAVKELAPCLRNMAKSTDDLVEAFWMPDKRFVWAVQWHPEFRFRTDADSQKLFEEFVRHCAK